MDSDPRSLLWDIQDAADAIARFTSSLDSSGYAENEIVRAAVERKFEIIGEALSQLAKRDPALARRIPDRVDRAAPIQMAPPLNKPSTALLAMSGWHTHVSV